MLDKMNEFATPSWAPSRWAGVSRNYTAADVATLSGSLQIRHTLAEKGAERLWNLLHSENYLAALGTFTGNQAVQQAKAGLKAIYLSGWQVAADANTSGNVYPDQSLYPSDSVPAIVRRINKALERADQIQALETSKGGKRSPAVDFFLPIVADAEAGFGGNLNAFELMKAMIEAGAAGVHFEDQLASEKKCGHLGGKVLVPTRYFIRTLNAARLAADVLGVPTLIIARTDAEAARLITSDIDDLDGPFITGERTQEGFYHYRSGIDAAIARGIAFAPYADLVWCETSSPNLAEAKRFSETVRKAYPEKMLAYNCSPSFNWSKHMDKTSMKRFQSELAAMGYKFQFITLAGFHNVSYSTFDLARRYAEEGMAAYSELQEAELAAERFGFTAVRHQREVGTGYFDQIAEILGGGTSSTAAMLGSTEAAQF